MISFHYLGASSAFAIEHRGGCIAIDPGTTVPEEGRRLLARVAPDLVLVTHGHPDHIDLDWVAELGVPVVAPADVADDLRARAVRTTLAAAGDAFDVGDVHLRAFAVDHGPVPNEVHNLGYELTMLGLRIVFLGDLREPLTSALPSIPIDVLFVPVGGSKVADPTTAADVVHTLDLAVGAMVVPMHAHRTPENFDEFAVLVAADAAVAVPSFEHPLVLRAMDGAR